MKTKILVILGVLLCCASITNAQWYLAYFGDFTASPPLDLITNGQVSDQIDGTNVNVGYEKDVNGNTNAVITKTINGGSVIWQRKLSGNSIYYSIIIASNTPSNTSGFSNGDYIVVGTTNGVLNWGGEGLICRYSNTGTLLASQAVSDPLWYLLFTDVCELPNGNITAVGYENNHNVNYPSAQNAFIETFDPFLSPGPMWVESISNPNSLSPTSIFLGVTCDASSIYVTGYTNNATNFREGTITKFSFGGGLISQRSYGVTYTNTEPATCTLNCLWLLKPVLAFGHLYVWGSITNWGLTGNDAGVLDVDPTALISLNYTSIHSPTNQWTNPQGLSSFCVLATDDFLFTAAPGSSQFDISWPYNPAFPPGFVRVSAGALNCSSSVNAGTSDFGYFALSSDGVGGISVGGFMDAGAGTPKFGLTGTTLAGWPCGGSAACVTGQPYFEVATQTVGMNILTWSATTPPVSDVSLADYGNKPQFAEYCHTEKKFANNAASLASANKIDICPNPTFGVSTLSITVAKATHIDIKLINSIGQEVSNAIQHFEKDVPAGNYKVEILSDMLSPGVYNCIVSLNGQQTTKRIVIY